MSIHIDKTHSLDKRDKLRDLVINGKTGDSLSYMLDMDINILYFTV